MKSNVFDTVLTNSPQINAKAIRLGLISILLGTGALAFGLSYVKMSAIESKLERLANRPIAVQVGKDAQIVKSKPLSPTENVEEYIKEVLPPMFAWSKRVLPEVHSSGIDPGRETRYGRLPTLIFYYTNALEMRYRNVFRRGIAQYKPEKFDQGEGLLMRIERVKQPRQTDEGWEVEVWADLISVDKNDVAYASEPFNSTVYLKEILPPKERSAHTPVEEAFAAVEQRGLIITRISKWED